MTPMLIAVRTNVAAAVQYEFVIDSLLRRQDGLSTPLIIADAIGSIIEPSFNPTQPMDRHVAEDFTKNNTRWGELVKGHASISIP